MRVLSVPLVGLSGSRGEASRQSNHHLGREHTLQEPQEELIDSITYVGVDLTHLIESSDRVVLWRLTEVYSETLAVRPHDLLVLFRSCKVESHVVTHVNLRGIDGMFDLEKRGDR